MTRLAALITKADALCLKSPSIVIKAFARSVKHYE